jgi:hypothetical protein
MKRMLPPGRHELYPDRDLDCQEAIEAAFQEFVERAVAAGWRPIEVAEAVGHLALADRSYRVSQAFVDAYNILDDVVANHRS